MDSKQAGKDYIWSLVEAIPRVLYEKQRHRQVRHFLDVESCPVLMMTGWDPVALIAKDSDFPREWLV